MPPDDLDKQVREKLEDNPELSWGEAVLEVMDSGEDEEEG